jgi:hypothetical protein
MFSSLYAAGHNLATACLPEQHRPEAPSPNGYSKSALEISRSFAPPRMSAQTRWRTQSCCRHDLVMAAYCRVARQLD